MNEVMQMFDKEYSFRGKHATMVSELTSALTPPKANNEQTFRNYDVYLLAPIVGFLYGKRAEKDLGNETTKIFAEILMKNQDDLDFNYRLIMLLDKDYEPNIDKRIDKAFRVHDDANDIERYESYVRGGVEKLHEKIIQDSVTNEDYMNHLFDFLEEFDERYNQTIDITQLQELYKKIK